MPWQKYVGNVSREWGNNLEIKQKQKDTLTQIQSQLQETMKQIGKFCFKNWLNILTLLTSRNSRNSRNSQDLLDINLVA